MKSLLLALSLAACAHYPEPKDSPDPEVGSLDRITDKQADAGTYKIYTPEMSQGTAWSIGDHLVMTAGHVCDDGAGYYLLVAADGTVIPARPLIWANRDNEDVPPVDVCLLETDAKVADPLPLAYEMPQTGDHVEYFGYPRGVYKHSEGEYRGDVDGPASHWNDYSSSAPCDHGASGSAMYYAGGVYGVLVRLHLSGDQVVPGSYGCVASPLDQIVGLLDSI